MAAERIGSSSNWIPPEDFGMDEPLLVETEKFTAQAINMYDMPSMKVLDIMVSTGQAQMVKMIELFRLAIINPKKVEDIDILSFNELVEAVGVWVNQSEPNDSEGEPSEGDSEPESESDSE